jgi:AcrR family transcriptional regulator
MQAKSALLRQKMAQDEKPPRGRLRYDERRQQILHKAEDIFAEYGLTAQTRSLAAACGISQRLLYRFFPNKSALLDEVYRHAILGPFRAGWFDQLGDRRLPVEQRLIAFYRDYFATVLTRRWMRLFLYSSLADVGMAPDYITSTIMRLLEVIVAEVAHEQGVTLPANAALQHEIGWTLHGAISHLAIRKHLYKASQSVPEETIIALHVRTFLAGFRATLASVAPPDGSHQLTTFGGGC